MNITMLCCHGMMPLRWPKCFLIFCWGGAVSISQIQPQNLKKLIRQRQRKALLVMLIPGKSHKPGLNRPILGLDRVSISPTCQLSRPAYRLTLPAHQADWLAGECRVHVLMCWILRNLEIHFLGSRKRSEPRVWDLLTSLVYKITFMIDAKCSLQKFKIV